MWPGVGRVRLGYGTIGGIVFDDGKTIQARQSRVPRLHSAGISLVSDAVTPKWQGHPNFKRPYLSARWDDLGVGYISSDLLADLNFESVSVESPAAVDPLLGTRVCPAPSNGEFESTVTNDIWYADSTYVRHVDDNDTVVKTLNMGSVVWQLDGSLARTANGVSIIRSDFSSVEPLVEGIVMDSSLLPFTSGAILTPHGELSTWDLQTGDCSWTMAVPRGSRSGWGRIEWSDPNTLAWCNRYELGLIDCRSNNLIHTLQFPDRQTEIKGLISSHKTCRNSACMDFWALTDYHLMWIDARVMKAVLSIEQPSAAKDKTLSLSAGSFRGHDLITLTSQLAPINIAWTFGRAEHDLPITACDPYIFESWPTQITQSHCSIENSSGDVWLYSVSREGGLYKQVLTADQNRTDDTLPLADATEMGDAHLSVSDFDLSNPPPKAVTSQFQNIWKWIYELQLPPLPPPVASSGVSQPVPGFKDMTEVRNHCSRMWVDPLRERGLTDATDLQSRYVDSILEDIAALPTALTAQEVDIDLSLAKLSKSTKELLAKWPIGDSTTDIRNDNSSQTDDLLSSSLSQPVPDDAPVTFEATSVAFSQPLPALRERSSLPARSKNPKHNPKHKSSKKRKRAKEGFL